MDSLIASAARLLATGDPLGGLKRVALRDDPPALALRGIAMAQLGDYQRARQLLRRAARGFGAREPLAQARCQVAEAEVALAARDLTWPMHRLGSAVHALAALGDHANALHTHLVAARRQLLVGELKGAEQTLAAADTVEANVPPALTARAELTRAELALRRVRVADATIALDRAQAAAVASGIPALIAEIGRVRRALSAPSARLIRAGAVRLVRLDEVEALFASGDLIVDGCRRAIRGRARTVPLARRPVLFDLVGVLAEAWPTDVPRDQLIERAFKARTINDSHRSRLRVELGRLRAALRRLARIVATRRGFVLAPIKAAAVVVLVPPIDGPAGSILALLEGGESWSTSALACALGSSQRTVQRALSQLEESAAVRAVGRGRSRRWLAPALGGFATTLLLPGALAVG
ncbi:MAG TPA: helix-turn-helix domain-containing protein [Candidatus Limnocylindrales bacterium]|nr:helix-turn-helix domain-containing protein [Candidatus Limnocylindrales bacterium]